MKNAHSVYRFPFIFSLVILLTSFSAADEPPVIPVGLDAYRMWDHWADQRIGQRTYMREHLRSCQRRKYVCRRQQLRFIKSPMAQSITLDLQGPGIVTFMRYNHWHGSPWHYTVDGVDHVLSESMSVRPVSEARQM